MVDRSIRRFSLEVVDVGPGEYFSSREDVIIHTVLGSCISVALFDARLGNGGLNHFLLPGRLEDADIARSESARYGMYAMELLFNGMQKEGTRKEDLVAKVFGGGSMLLGGVSAMNRIPAGNIEFAFKYLEREGIPVVAKDVGGRGGRKIFLFARTGRVLLKRVGTIFMDSVAKDEERFLEAVKAREPVEARLFADDRTLGDDRS